ncbi:ABC transporter permease [Ornithinimicrobium cavernae]|uniref:ABC transporter permease n=1 Tax=Ornithinimicrobium cavernae TaxID=2666047 RepID=UPI000D69416F|nr:ABC transporter permease subunit [Ornithinimicrobium cavernae]
MAVGSVRWRPVALGAAGVLGLVVLWEGYKALGPAEGVTVAGQAVLPRTTDLGMPHVWDMIGRALEPATSIEGAAPVWLAVVQAALVTLGTATAGLLLGTVVGILLALLMQRFVVAEWAVQPWLILSQTVPLIALAPLVVSWGGRLQLGPVQWETWMSVGVIASYLAFFPMAVGALRGLKSPEAAHTDLFRTYATSWWTTLLRLRLPAAVPYLLPALRLATAAAILGAVVAEVSTGHKGGIGRLIIEYAQSGSADPAKAWAPIAGAVLLGLFAAGLVYLLGLALGRYRRQEETA